MSYRSAQTWMPALHKRHVRRFIKRAAHRRARQVTKQDTRKLLAEQLGIDEMMAEKEKTDGK